MSVPANKRSSVSVLPPLVSALVPYPLLAHPAHLPITCCPAIPSGEPHACSARSPRRSRRRAVPGLVPAPVAAEADVPPEALRRRYKSDALVAEVAPRTASEAGGVRDIRRRRRAAQMSRLAADIAGHGVQVLLVIIPVTRRRRVAPAATAQAARSLGCCAPRLGAVTAEVAWESAVEAEPCRAVAGDVAEEAAEEAGAVSRGGCAVALAVAAAAATEAALGSRLEVGVEVARLAKQAAHLLGSEQ